MQNSAPSGEGSFVARIAVPVLSVFFVCTFVLWAYYPGTTGPLLLDDARSLTLIDRENTDASKLFDLVTQDPSGHLGRPVSIASFALEKWLIDRGAVGHKLVNICLHVSTGVLLFFFLLLLLRNWFSRPELLALIVCSVWLVSPLFVSTVLYSVQRMAMLACFFMLLTLSAYVLARSMLLAGKTTAGIVFAVLGGAAFLAGLYSKENSIVAIPVLVAMEVLWFECRGASAGHEHRLASFFRLALIGVFAVFFCTMVWAILVPGMFHSYELRDFTAGERLLTQSTILWDYINQFFWPELTRLGLYHDDWPVSRGLVSPVSTAYSVAAWSAVILLIFFGRHVRLFRLVGFGVLFYLLGHSIESTVLPLELYFEHRSYFPAVGLLIVAASLLGAAFDRWPKTRAPLACWGAIYFFVLLMSLSSQVQIWSRYDVLALHHINGHPDSVRANSDMAVLLASAGNLDSALSFSSRVSSLKVRSELGDELVRNLVLSCLAKKELPDFPLLEKAVDLHNGVRIHSVLPLESLVNLVQQGRCQNVDMTTLSGRIASIALVNDSPDKVPLDGYIALAIFENHLENYHRGLEYVERALSLQADHAVGHLIRLQFAVVLGFQDRVIDSYATLEELRLQNRLSNSELDSFSLYARPGELE